MTATDKSKTSKTVSVRRQRFDLGSYRPKSILDNDLYKFSMANAVLIRHPDIHVTYQVHGPPSQRQVDQSGAQGAAAAHQRDEQDVAERQ